MTKTERAEKILRKYLTSENLRYVSLREIIKATFEFHDTEISMTDTEIREAIKKDRTLPNGRVCMSEYSIKEKSIGAMWYRDYLKR